jgi:hypothetical protein
MPDWHTRDMVEGVCAGGAGRPSGGLGAGLAPLRDSARRFEAAEAGASAPGGLRGHAAHYRVSGNSQVTGVYRAGTWPGAR